jgi:hypothetical protein
LLLNKSIPNDRLLPAVLIWIFAPE